MEPPDPYHPAFRFVLAGLASWRLAFLAVRESGPAGVLDRLRRRLDRGPGRGLLECVKCVGLWTSLPFAFFVGASVPEVLVAWLALAGVVALIDEWLKPPFEWREEKPDEMLRPGRDEGDHPEPTGEDSL
ncbi:hypothetical protein OJF2_18240 [Aquisphaera giovannonii]|uniref:DUF1360 domain-containing protein n=1 Tax=Aquisphaera giovannonii TaxID=406548 RepID=A0A5B9VYA2_9BACT|nr:hypothetical protein [Aquisphaera giovannonii]QEH33323.1 hypothetical protein OJF2_18240 [Aquisphaera giovannonii]